MTVIWTRPKESKLNIFCPSPKVASCASDEEENEEIDQRAEQYMPFPQLDAFNTQFISMEQYKMLCLR